MTGPEGGAEPDAEKRRLRAAILLRRASLPEAERREAAARAAAHLLAWPPLIGHEGVLLHVAVRGELATDALERGLRARGVRIALPRILDRAGTMEAAWADAARRELVPGPFGIPQPGPAAERAAHVDGVVAPGVAFDACGGRLGHGLGYYDRFLSGAVARGALLIGWAYAFQVIDRVPTGPQDVPMVAVASEEGVLETVGRGSPGR